MNTLTKNTIRLSEWAASLKSQKAFYMAVIDVNGRLTFVNTPFLKAFQHEQTPPVSKAFLGLIHQQDSDKVMQAITGCREDGNRTTVEARMKNGHYNWIKWEISPLLGSERPEGKLLCLGYDIPGEDQQQKYNHIAGQHYLAILEGLTIGVLFQDKDGSIVAANEKAAEMLETTLDKLYNDNDIFSKWKTARSDDPSLPPAESPFIKALTTAETQSDVVVDLVGPDGHSRSILWNAQPLFENGGSVPYSVVSTLQDVTEIQRLEQQLATQKLKQQKKTAEAIIHAQQEERVTLGHELHDNINQILVSAQLFLGQLSPANEEFDFIKEKTKEILSLAIEEIRNLSRNMVLPDFKETGLTGSISNLADDLQYCKTFDIRFHYTDRHSVEALDSTMKVTLFRIVQEQIKNIVKYSNARNVVIDLFCNTEQVRLEIADDGKGFDPATVRRGLGLANIYERTSLYNGKVILNTSPGQGCTLIVNIPLDGRQL